MINIDNYGIVDGRMVEAPQVFDNKDGSKKVRIKVAVQDNFTNKAGDRGSQFIPLEAFISADKNGNLGIYGTLGKGDKVKAEYTVRNNNYTDKDGQAHYDIVLVIDTIKKQEPKSVTDARHAAAAAQAEPAAEAE